MRNLIELGVSPTALYRDGDGYYGIAVDSTTLHVAAWRACHDVVTQLIARGTPVDALDGHGERDVCRKGSVTFVVDPHNA